jgi:hypothetical protein
VGRSAAEIFEGLGAYMESEDQETFLQVMEKVIRLSIFSFATSQEIDREAKELTSSINKSPITRSFKNSRLARCHNSPLATHEEGNMKKFNDKMHN